MKIIIKTIIWYMFVCGFIFYGSVVGFWLFYPYEPIIIDIPIKIMNLDKQVKAGELLIYKIKYIKKMDISGNLTRKLVNSYKMDLADSVANAPIGSDCDQIKILVPKFADPGKYYLWWSCEYQVNPIRKITVTAVSEKFEVVK